MHAFDQGIAEEVRHKWLRTPGKLSNRKVTFAGCVLMVFERRPAFEGWKTLWLPFEALHERPRSEVYDDPITAVIVTCHSFRYLLHVVLSPCVVSSP